MLSKKTKKLLLQSGVALSITLSSFGISSFQPVTAYAAVVDTAGGTLTVTAASLWAYSAPSWTAKVRTYGAGTTLRVVEKHSVDGRYMYKLDNGLYISANTAYVSFAPSGAVTPAPAPTPAPTPSGDIRTTTANLNLRSGASTGTSILATIPKGTAVTIQSVSGTWAKLSYAGKTGYVATAYLTQTSTPTPPPVTTPTPAPTPSGDIRTTTANLNLRSGASTGTSILATIPRGTAVTVQSVSGTWAKVSYAGKTGYVATAYLTAPSTTTPPPVTTPTPAPTPSGDIRTTTANLNLRSGASTGTSILATIPKGTALTVQSVSGTWAKVSYAGKTGYVATTYLTAPAAQPEKVVLPTMMTLDESPFPTYNNADIILRGWTISDAGISEVKIFVDGIEVGSATRETRADVESLFTNYPNRANSGFRYTIPKNTLSIGSHVVTVKSISNDGTAKEYQYTSDMVKESPVVAITSHDSGSKVNLVQTTIQGYALNVDGVAGVEVYLNGTKLSGVTYGTAVAGLEAYAAYQNFATSGFSVTFDTRTMNQGANTVKVVMRGKDGTDKSYSITLNNTEIYLFRDYPGTLTDYANVELGKGTSAISVGGSWTLANIDQIKQYMNPTTYMNDPIYKYMFMKLDYIEVDTAIIDRLIEGKGILSGMGEVIKTASKANNINPLYVVAHAILETGNGNSVLANGVVVTGTHAQFNVETSTVTLLETPVTVYNMFGIGAYDTNPNLWGSEKALSLGWTTPELALAGGIEWIAKGYINHATYQQDTLYKMRYRIGSGGTHQYATDIAWHYKQAKILYNAFANIPDLPRFEFEIPRFKAE